MLRKKKNMKSDWRRKFWSWCRDWFSNNILVLRFHLFKGHGIIWSYGKLFYDDIFLDILSNKWRGIWNNTTVYEIIIYEVEYCDFLRWMRVWDIGSDSDMNNDLWQGQSENSFFVEANSRLFLTSCGEGFFVLIWNSWKWFFDIQMLHG